jgi:hypothetical protein
MESVARTEEYDWAAEQGFARSDEDPSIAFLPGG